MKETPSFLTPNPNSLSLTLRRRPISGEAEAATASPSPRPSSIPFSWEHLPGVPKHPRIPKSHPNPNLPLPPSLKCAPDPPRRKKPDPIASSDPFAAALAECAKETTAPNSGIPDLDEFWSRGATIGRRGPVAAAIVGRFGLIRFPGSCKTACSVSDSTIRITRGSIRTGTGTGTGTVAAGSLSLGRRSKISI